MKEAKRTPLAKPPTGVGAVSSDAPVGYGRAKVSSLSFDYRNPRLAEYGFGPETPEDEILKTLWKVMAVDEIAMSIAASGYWDHEPLFVTKEHDKDVVLEGNRRLAALKILRSSSLREKLKATDLPPVAPERLTELEEVPVIRVAERKDVWRYLGFKHVNGPAKWRSYAKAQYIAFVHKSAPASLADIAAQIGDRHRTVQRLFRALMVIEQAEKTGVYKREWVYGSRLAFSHLMTALEYDEYAAFLRLKDTTEESVDPVDKKRIKALGELCLWLWGDRRNNTEPIIKSQNPDLRNLARVLVHAEALRTLRLGQGLSAALEVSKGDEIVFEEALQQAKNALAKAQGRVSTGYRGEPHLLELADAVADMSEDLLRVMQSKSSKLRRRRGHSNKEADETTA